MNIELLKVVVLSSLVGFIVKLFIINTCMWRFKNLRIESFYNCHCIFRNVQFSFHVQYPDYSSFRFFYCAKGSHCLWLLKMAWLPSRDQNYAGQGTIFYVTELSRVEKSL